MEGVRELWLEVIFPLRAVVLVGLLVTTPNLSAQTLEWLQRSGVAGFDEALSVAADDSGVYVAGRIREELPVHPAGYELDGYLRKYAPDGSLLWTQRFEVDAERHVSFNTVWSVAAADSGIYLSGTVECSDGCRSGGFVIRFDRRGNRSWTHVFDQMHSATSLVIRDSGIYVGGTREGVPTVAVLAKIDLRGNLIWRRDVGSGMRLGPIAVDDQAIYATGFLGTADIRIFDLDGHEIDQIGDGSIGYQGIAVDETGVYAAGEARPSVGATLRKYRHSGELVWQKEQVLEPASLRLDEEGLIVLYGTGQRPAVARYTRDGTFLWQGRFGEKLLAHGLAVLRDRIYFSGSAFDGSEQGTDSFVAAVSPLLPPQLVSLGMMLGSPTLAVLTQDPATQAVSVRTKGAASGNLISSVHFGDAIHPQDLVAVLDVNGNGFPEIALLGIHRTTGRVFAQVRDSLTGSRLASVTFHRVQRPLQFSLIPDAAGDGRAALGVFGLSDDDRVVRAEIRGAIEGDLIQTISFGEWGSDNDALDVVLRGASPSGNPTVAHVWLPIPVFGGLPAEATIKDALTGTITGEFSIGGGHDVLGAVSVQNLGGAPGAEIATLERGRIRSGIRATFRDGRTGAHLRDIYFTRAGTGERLIEIPDLNGNGSAEIGLLSSGVEPGIDTVEIKDPATGEWIRRVWLWHVGHQTLDLELVPDVSGNGAPEIGQLQRRQNALSVLMKDAVSGDAVGRVYF